MYAAHLGRVFCICLLDLVSLFKSYFLILLSDLSIIVKGVLKSSTIVVELSISLFNFVNFFSMYFDGLLLAM